MRLFHAHACLRAGRYYEAQLQLPVEWKEEGCPTPEQGCRVSYDPDLYYNPDALPIRLEQPLQMPAPVTTREAHEAETDPLLRMAPGYERYKRISLLYETSLTDTFRQVGPEDGGDEGRKKFIVHLARKCRAIRHPGGRCRLFCPDTPVRQGAGDGVEGDVRERLQERKTLQRTGPVCPGGCWWRCRWKSL